MTFFYITGMTGDIDESPPSCAITMLGMIVVAFPAAMIVIWIVLIDVNDLIDLFVVILSFVPIIALTTRAAWCATKRTKKWIAHLDESQSSEEIDFAGEDE
ncbi:hypothetical protein EU537_12265 [Candidatus Thorarchaeota archaeon]|nr:MAG: hypothetical protein EU537_12265 [Candidatus Thorarchaeota archaeon]